MNRPANKKPLMPLNAAPRATKFLAGLLIVATAVSPFFASWHDASVQHITCAEHGQLIHASAPHDHGGSNAGALAAVQSEENPTPSDEHGHCDIAFVVQGRAEGPQVRDAVRFTPPSVVLRPMDVLCARPGRASILASAPKTSPPIG